MMKKLLPVITFAKIDIKRLFRDKVGIFFVFLFPLILLLIFGSIFGRESEVSFNVAVFNQSSSQFSKDFTKQIKNNDVFNVEKNLENRADAKDLMSRGEIDAIIVLPENFGTVKPGEDFPSGEAKVTHDQGDDQAGNAIGSILGSIFDGINQRLTPSAEPFTVSVAAAKSEANLSSFDFIFSGLLGFTILSLGVFGPTTVFPRMKERGVLRRYHTTPVRVWQYFAGNVLSTGFIGLLSVAAMFITALIVFDLNMRGDYISLVLMTILGAVVLFGIGLAAGGWAKNENQAAPLAQLIALPMLFLSGVFFPRFLMPDWLLPITGFLPLTPLIDGFRAIIAEGQTILQIGSEVGLLAAWGVIIYAIAFKVFRWE